MRRGGFDAVVSNPPFMGGKKVSGALGSDFREYLIQHIGREGQARATPIYAPTSCSVTSLSPGTAEWESSPRTRIAQGDTREVGLDQVSGHGLDGYRAEKSQPWPGTASLEVSLVWAGHPGREMRAASSTGIESQA